MIEDFDHLIEKILFQVTGNELEPDEVRMENGGCINMAVSVTTSVGKFFIKWNELEFEDMFEKEAKGLEILQSSNTVSVPGVIGFGNLNEKSFLVLEHLEETSATQNYWENLGHTLAQMHQIEAKKCGLAHNNYISKLNQHNAPTESWLEFYKEHRLNHQLGLAIYNEYVDSVFVNEFKSFLNKLDQILLDSKPCLLHGDLWNGNAMCSDDKAYVFDPAIYYGAPEVDLAMTRLFGGFNEVFYSAYNEINPISSHFEESLDVYSLYPLLVHANLFGPESGYLGSVKRIVKRYL